jgi:hypothetical protein
MAHANSNTNAPVRHKDFVLMFITSDVTSLIFTAKVESDTRRLHETRFHTRRRRGCFSGYSTRLRPDTPFCVARPDIALVKYCDSAVLRSGY